MVGLFRVIRNGPRSLASFLALKGLGWRPQRPWISYAACAVIGKQLSGRQCSVLEFGSGMSTLWFVRRVERICSVEHDRYWYDLLKRKTAALGYGSPALDYHLRTDVHGYSRIKAGSNERFDILLVDGPWRTECLKHHLRLIKPGGLIYLDNSDADSSSGETGEIDQAVEQLVAHARTHQATIERFTDFSPTCLFATEGVMVRMPS